MSTDATTGGGVMTRRAVIDLLNEALSCEYHSFIGHALSSNPYVKPEWEGDLATLQSQRDAENDNTRALLVQLGRYRAGPTLKAFRHWKEDLNFLSLEWLIIRLAEEAPKEVARVEALIARLPPGDPQLAASFHSLLLSKRAQVETLVPLAEKRVAERDARRATHRAATAIKLKGVAAPKPIAKPAAAPAGAPNPPGAPKAPPLPAGFKMPAAPSKPTPPKPPMKAPPLPPGFKMPPTPPGA